MHRRVNSKLRIRESWECTNPNCGIRVRISDNHLLEIVVSLLNRLITKIRKAKPTDVFSIGNPFDGYKYIPRSSILYAETGDIVEEDPMVRKLREAGCFP